jgi:hypothetical protein
MAFMAVVALITLSAIPRPVHATALTYSVAAHERACFYTWTDVPKKKLGFYFAVRIASPCFALLLATVQHVLLERLWSPQTAWFLDSPIHLYSSQLPSRYFQFSLFFTSLSPRSDSLCT